MIDSNFIKGKLLQQSLGCLSVTLDVEDLFYWNQKKATSVKYGTSCANDIPVAVENYGNE